MSADAAYCSRFRCSKITITTYFFEREPAIEHKNTITFLLDTFTSDFCDIVKVIDWWNTIETRCLQLSLSLSL